MNINFWTFLLCVLLLETIIPCNNTEVINCRNRIGICEQEGCNELSTLKYSSTFCDSSSGNCMCDCRDIPSEHCSRDPDSDCNLFCETKNPNPQVFTYIGSYCPVASTTGNTSSSIVCSCMCYLNDDYVEVNDV